MAFLRVCLTEKKKKRRGFKEIWIQDTKSAAAIFFLKTAHHQEILKLSKTVGNEDFWIEHSKWQVHQLCSGVRCVFSGETFSFKAWQRMLYSYLRGKGRSWVLKKKERICLAFNKRNASPGGAILLFKQTTKKRFQKEKEKSQSPNTQSWVKA